MKMKKKHFDYMKAEIDKILADYPNLIDVYEHGRFPRSDRVKDLQVRFNHDLMFGAGLTKWVCDNLYSYLHDDHIATALRSICPKIERKY